MRAPTAGHLIATFLTLGGVVAVASGGGVLDALPRGEAEAAPASEARSGNVFAPARVAPALDQVRASPRHSFHFTRAAYRSSFRSRSWATDYPQADYWIIGVLSRLTGIDVYPDPNPVRLDDPGIRRYPFLYAVEVGYMGLSEPEVEALRSYLLAGGFLVVDDFWGTAQWRAFIREMKRVLPEYDAVELSLDHPIFSTFYQIDEIIQVPNIGQGRAGGPTHEQDGYVPRVFGISDENGRMMVLINWNTDLGDAWEWGEDPYYPLRFSTFAYQMGANFIVYAMTR